MADLYQAQANSRLRAHAGISSRAWDTCKRVSMSPGSEFLRVFVAALIGTLELYGSPIFRGQSLPRIAQSVEQNRHEIFRPD